MLTHPIKLPSYQVEQARKKYKAYDQRLLRELILLQIPGCGPRSRARLIERFESLEQAFACDPKSWPIKLTAAITYQLLEQSGELYDKAHACIDWCEHNGISILYADHDAYPSAMQTIDAPPPVLFAKGNLALLTLPAIGIVGTRHPSQSGLNTTRDFASVLAGSGFTIVSGLAKGVDAIAHSAAMNVKGTTIAVLGTGIDKQYPHCNRAIYDQMNKSNQLILSEFWPGTIPSPKNFPRRNRLISALSLGVLVTEAAVKSGSLVTARYAAEQGKEVFAVPGSIHNPMAKGCHHLINQGAKLTQDAHELVQAISPELQQFVERIQTPSEESEQLSSNVCPTDAVTAQIFPFIGFDPVDLDTLVARSNLPVAQILEELTLLELEGTIACENGGYLRVN